MKYQTRSVRHLTDIELLSKLHSAANLYSKYAESSLLFLFSKDKLSEYNAYEVFFHKYNFMHLAGIKSETLSAETFFEACLSRTVKRKDCSPRHSITNIYEKVSVINSLLDFKNCKCYRIGKKDLITRDNDFEMATGNNSGVIGYDHRISKKGTATADKTKLAVPTTLITTPITQLVAKPEKIMFILQKKSEDNTYSKVFYEIKKGLLMEKLSFFSKEIQSLIELNI